MAEIALRELIDEKRLQHLQQIQDLRLDRHIESGCRLIGKKELRVAGKSHSDNDTLLHTTDNRSFDPASCSGPAGSD